MQAVTGVGGEIYTEAETDVIWCAENIDKKVDF